MSKNKHRLLRCTRKDPLRKSVGKLNRNSEGKGYSGKHCCLIIS